MSGTAAGTCGDELAGQSTENLDHSSFLTVAEEGLDASKLHLDDSMATSFSPKTLVPQYSPVRPFHSVDQSSSKLGVGGFNRSGFNNVTVSASLDHASTGLVGDYSTERSTPYSSRATRDLNHLPF